MSSIPRPASLESRIFVIRGQRVMLDADLAQLYDVETRALNQAVRRNIERFPADFMFALTREEIGRISQFVISSGRPDIRFSRRVSAFTENGVAMLSGVLNSPRAIQASVEIMRTFTRLRGALTIHKAVLRKLALLERKISVHADQLELLTAAIRELGGGGEQPRKRIGFRAG